MDILDTAETIEVYAKSHVPFELDKSVWLRIATLVGTDRVKYIDDNLVAEEDDEAVRGDILVVTQRRVILAKLAARVGEEGHDDLAVATWARSALRQASIRPTKSSSWSRDFATGPEWPPQGKIDLTYADGTSLTLPLGDADAETLRRLRELVPSLLDDIGGAEDIGGASA